MREFIIVAALAAPASVAGCSSSPSCAIPAGVPLTTTVSAVASSADNCPADVVTGLEDLSGSTMTFEGGALCTHFELIFINETTSASCTADGSLAFSDFSPNAGGLNEGSGGGTFDIMCSDGTSCTQALEVTLMDAD
jgi:hypothetical protein